MRQRREWIAVVALAAAALPAAIGHAQQAPASSNRLMFDPTGMQGEQRRTFTPSQPSTTGQQVATPKSTPTTQDTPPPKPVAPKPTAAPKPAQQASAPKPAQQATSPKPAQQATAPKPAQQAAAPKPQERAAPNPPSRTATPRKPAPAQTLSEPAPTNRSRTINSDPIETPSLGRVPLTTGPGTFGFESQTQLKDYRTSDGDKVPGFENRQRNDSSYFGLSLRMPTSSSPLGSILSHGPN